MLETRPDEATDAREVRDPRWMMLIGGVVGLVAAATLTIEKVRYLTELSEGREPTTNCDLNAFVSCGGVINTPEASAFGFPNPIIGIVGFTVVLTLGVLLASGVRLPGWIWEACRSASCSASGS